MDTPQIDASTIDRATDHLSSERTDAVLGLAPDGGYWSIGLERPDPRALEGVPMSRDDTGRLQHERLVDLGLRTTLIEEVRDVDHWPDALEVAADAPHTAFAEAVRRAADRIGAPA